MAVQLGNRMVGDGHPTYVIGEIGINHNGDLDTALRIVDAAVEAGCDAVKFQKRDPEQCVPEAQRDVLRETPWGTMTYLDYRYKVEFGSAEYDLIAEYCNARGIDWFASPWDTNSVAFLEAYPVPCFKAASASLTDIELLDAMNRTGKPVMLSSGMSTSEEIHAGAAVIDEDRLLLAHSTSTYPCPVEQLNLRMIQTLRSEFPVPIGYSGHEVGLQTTVAAVVLGATFVERHITLDRAMWGSDQSASIEPGGLRRLVRDIRAVEAAMGDGVKQVYEAELPVKSKLRRV